MKKNTVKRISIPLVAVVFSLLFSACHKTLPTASFSYRIISGTSYATCELTNYSYDADSYEWTLTRPDGTTERSSDYAPSFRCYQVGRYTIKLAAINRYGMDFSTQSFDILYNGGGNGGGGNDQTALAYTITWLRLEKIPMLDGNNGSWDTGLFGSGDPDIYFMIQDASNTTTYYTSSVKEDVSESDYPVTWYNVNTTLQKGVEYRIRFLDQDGSVDPDDIMANCVWKQTGYFSPGATSFTWQNHDNDIRFTVGLTWIYNESDINEIITPGILDDKPTDGENTPVCVHQ